MEDDEVFIFLRNTLEAIYHKIDVQCISETDHVRMKTIAHEFESYGARREEMDFK